MRPSRLDLGSLPDGTPRGLRLVEHGRDQDRLPPAVGLFDPGSLTLGHAEHAKPSPCHDRQAGADRTAHLVLHQGPGLSRAGIDTKHQPAVQRHDIGFDRIDRDDLGFGKLVSSIGTIVSAKARRRSNMISRTAKSFVVSRKFAPVIAVSMIRTLPARRPAHRPLRWSPTVPGRHGCSSALSARSTRR